ncbi:hypothetical protein V1511DRAFT_348761 [Dipodascopsis uninucleata]
MVMISPEANIGTEEASKLQNKLKQKYGIWPSRSCWIDQVYRKQCASGLLRLPSLHFQTGDDKIFLQFENEFLKSNLEACIPPILEAVSHSRSGDETLHSLDEEVIQREYEECLKYSTLIPQGVESLQSTTLSGPITLQIVELQEIGISRNEQLRRLEESLADEKSERVVVREIPPDSNTANILASSARMQSQDSSFSQSDVATKNIDLPYHELQQCTKSGRKMLVGKSICKVLLQDPLGRVYWGIEQKPVNGLEVGLKLGVKITLKNITISRGVFLLKPTSVTLHGGGYIEEWNFNFHQNLLNSLRSAIFGESNTPILVQRNEQHNLKIDSAHNVAVDADDDEFGCYADDDLEFLEYEPS